MSAQKVVAAGDFYIEVARVGPAVEWVVYDDAYIAADSRKIHRAEPLRLPNGLIYPGLAKGMVLGPKWLALLVARRAARRQLLPNRVERYRFQVERVEQP